MLYQLLTREFVPPKGNAVIRTGASVLLRCIPVTKRPALRQKLLKNITRYNEDTSLEMVCIETVGSLGTTYAPDLTDHFVWLPFQDGEFMCFAGWDEHLKRKFGDYMQLPPESERAWKHHPIIIDFEHNYEELG